MGTLPGAHGKCSQPEPSFGTYCPCDLLSHVTSLNSSLKQSDPKCLPHPTKRILFFHASPILLCLAWSLATCPCRGVPGWALLPIPPTTAQPDSSLSPVSNALPLGSHPELKEGHMGVVPLVVHSAPSHYNLEHTKPAPHLSFLWVHPDSSVQKASARGWCTPPQPCHEAPLCA